MVETHGRAALVSLAEVRGSSPREPGARMILEPAGGFHGTIGGGAIEWEAIRRAGRMLTGSSRPQAALERFALGPDLGQCCGGSVQVLTECFDRERIDEIRALAAREAQGRFITRGRVGTATVERKIIDIQAATNALLGNRSSNSSDSSKVAEGHADALSAIGSQGRGSRIALAADGTLYERFDDVHSPVWLFGAGHVGRALVLALAPLPFDIVWVDERPDAFPERMPANARPLPSDDAAADLARAPDGAMIVVMTHSHPLDLAIVHAALAAERFSYVGLIGSASKRARFIRRLRDAGIASTTIDSLICPVGSLDIRSKLPAAIALGIAAQLLEHSESSTLSGEKTRPDPATTDRISLQALNAGERP